MQQLNSFLCNDFIFSPRYRVWRHIIYWSFHTMIWAAFWVVMGAPGSYGRQLFNQALVGTCFYFIRLSFGVWGHSPFVAQGKSITFLPGCPCLGRHRTIYRYRIQVLHLYSDTRGDGIGFHFTQGTIGLLLPVHDDFRRQPHDHKILQAIHHQATRLDARRNRKG